MSILSHTAPPLHASHAAPWASAVLVHGFTGSPAELGALPARLTALGIACDTPLLPGHGSSPDALALTSWTDWSAAVDDAVERARARELPLFLLGMSLGALLVLRSAVRVQPAGVLAGVVTLGVPLVLDRVTRSALPLFLALGSSLPDLRSAKRGGSDITDPIARAQSANYRENPLRAARWLHYGGRLVRALLPALRAPLLAVHGALDHVAEPRGSLELARAVGSLDVTRLVLARSAHGVAVDREHGVLEEALARWVLKHRAR